MEAMLASLSQWLEPWADLYGGSAALSTGVTAVHLAGVLVGGGLALASDRATLRALRHPRALAHHLDELAAVHRPVLLGLAVTGATGALMLAADLESLASSPVFWIKMLVLAALLANGALIRGAARRLARQIDSASWRGRLAGAARASAALWLAALVLGAVLPAT